MKKLLTIVCAMTILSGYAAAAETPVKRNPEFDKPKFEKRVPPTKEQIEQHRKMKEAAFENKLGLTEVQKLKARELRKEGFNKIKPVMEELKAKKIEADKIQKSDLTVEAKEERLTVIDKDIKSLQKQAATVRKQNMKDFESILTHEQKKTLKQMKKEGRNKFHDEHRKGLNPPPPPKREIK